MNTTEIIGGLKAITTNAELHQYLNTPDVAQSFPTEHDARHFLARNFSEDPTLNWCRSLDQINVVRSVSRNFGATAEAGMLADPGMLIGLPTPKALFDVVWKLVPDFLKTKITQWAKSNTEGPIANEITEYVKRGLGLLPVPIPAFFVNAITNLVIPPLVSHIISVLSSPKSVPPGFPIFAYHTAKSLEVMKNYDRNILLSAGLKPSELPAHLRLPTDNESAMAPHHNVAGQPDDRESRVDIYQFYQSDAPNGWKPLSLTQVVAAQLRTNPASDEPGDIFGLAVWKTLDADTKAKLKKAAGETPPNMPAIADVLYTPTRNILQKGPYNVPGPILDSFTSMKAPEVTEYVLTIQK